MIFTEELAEQLLEEEGLTHADIERLVRYVWLVQSYPLDKQGESYYKDNLAKWVSDEEETYYGEHESTEEFTRYYLENYCELTVPNWVCIDYQGTWNANLRHDFTTEENGRTLWVWADVY